MNVTKDSPLVLVVDDSPETVGMLNDTLERAGMSTLVALEGDQAIRIARRMSPDIILLDAVMPEMDGFEVCRTLKADRELQAIPVIFMTGLKESENVLKGFECGGTDYITKPIVTNELIARIRVHLANSRLTRSAQTALDTAGQCVFAVNNRGQLLWTTPQVHKIFDAADNNNGLKQELEHELVVWLQHNPNIGMGIDLEFPNRSIRLVYVGNSGPDEVLLRIIDKSKPNEILMLCENFNLTARESEVLRWLTHGKTNRDIGLILGTSPRTVNKHLEQVYKKLEVENRTAAAAKVLHSLER